MTDPDGKRWGPFDERRGRTPPIVNDVLRAAGRPLDPVARAFLEPRFGVDFGFVRVHAGDRVAESARAVGALAYTVGRDIVFDRDQYAPGTSTGRRLLAHELAHVVQETTSNHVRRYRDVKRSERTIKNWGGVDEPGAGLVEKSSPGSGDPVIETIAIKFTGNAPDALNGGEFLVTGRLTAKYRASDKRPDIMIPVTGGSTAGRPFGLTDRITTPVKVRRIEGPGYSDVSTTARPEAQPAPAGEASHYVKRTTPLSEPQFSFVSSMGLAVYFKGPQAIHLGDRTFGSHACVHVDWIANKEEMRLINYHSLIHFTKVTVAYEKNAALREVCCATTRMRRGFVNPCDVFKRADCTP